MPVCELLVWHTDRESSGYPHLDMVKYVRGDVIVAMPDGHDWTVSERTHPKWLIIAVPDMSLSEGQALAVEEPREPGRSPVQESKKCHQFRLNYGICGHSSRTEAPHCLERRNLGG